jgi:signal transduction histidine kinase
MRHWWIGAFSIFGALILISMYASKSAQTSRNDIQDYAEPTSSIAASVQQSLLRCELALVAFQATGRAEYAASYETELEGLLKSLQSAKLLSAKLGADTPARFEELRRSVENWNSLIHREHLIDTSFDSQTLRPSLMQQADLLRTAYDTAADLQGVVHSRIAELQRNTASGERRTLALTAMLCAFGLVSMGRLCTIARRWRANSVLRDDVLRVVSHDLSNPLNTIQLAASMWQTSAPAARQPYPEVILRAVRRMGRLIQDLRDITAMESGHALALNIKCLELKPILEEVREAAECLAQGKAIQLSFDFPETPISVFADRTRLLQVFFNLVDNAIKFTPKKGSIVMDCARVGSQIRFSITDTGPGIPQHELKNVFNFYWQAAATAHLGCGLGLATAKRVVEQHGGRIWVESALGSGATFTFTIPGADEVRSVA